MEAVVHDVLNRPRRRPPGRTPVTVETGLDEALCVDSLGLSVHTVGPGKRVPDGSTTTRITRRSRPRRPSAVSTADEPLVIDASELLFGPLDRPNCAHDAGDETVRLVAVGAPKVTGTALVGGRCPSGGEVIGRQGERVDDGDAVLLRCSGCGVETDWFAREA